jgi:putative flippase GtrA
MAFTEFQHIRSLGKFGLLGVMNTLLDFLIFNALGKFAGLPPILANIVSISMAMSFSFFANRHYVFRNRDAIAKQASIFFATTAIGLFVIQNGIIWMLLHQWTMPTQFVLQYVRSIGIQVFADAFYVNNTAKAAATGASLVWNYTLYKNIVFKLAPMS